MTATTAGRDRDPLGAALFASGLISAANLARADEEASEAGEALGQVLLRLGLVSETDLVVTNALRLGHLYVELDEYPVDMTAVARLPEPTARRMHAIPIDWDEGRLVVAMTNPSDVVAKDDLRLLTGSEIKPVVVTPTALEVALNRLYRFEDGEFTSSSAEESVADASLDVTVDDAPIVKLVNGFIGQAMSDRASDIHVEPGEHEIRIRYRIDGVLHDISKLPRSAANAVLSRLKIMADIDISERRMPQDGRITATFGGTRADLRVATLPTVYGEQATIRIIDRSAPILSLEDVGFLPEELEVYERLLRFSSGTILTTGPTGSGKTTTLYATLAQLNVPSRKVITVEDPVEYRLAGAAQVQVNNRAGLTFAAALRSMLRSDPDVVLVGEIRDRETAQIAIEAALTGHVVLSSLHTNDAASAAVRLVEMGIEPYLVATALDGVIAQRLARVACPRCKELADPTPAQKGVFEDNGVKVPEGVVRVVGCSACGRTGYRGRVAVIEILPVTEYLEGLIADGARSDHLRTAARDAGMRSMLEIGLRHAAAGATTIDEVLRITA